MINCFLSWMFQYLELFISFFSLLFSHYSKVHRCKNRRIVRWISDYSRMRNIYMYILANEEKCIYANRFLVERSLIRGSVSRKEKRTSPMKYCRWLGAFKGLSKRIYGSPLNPMKNTSARGKVEADGAR